MKTFLLLIFSAITLATQAQTSVYHPFPDSNALWNMEYYNSASICDDRYHYSYIFDGDTLISSISYHKIRIPDTLNISTDPCHSGVHHGNAPGFIGSLRQNIASKKVYFIPPNSSTESVLYDFNLNIGDTLNSVVYIGPGQLFIVTMIDSILIGNSYRKKFIVKDTNQISFDFDIIEGIGSTAGLFEYPYVHNAIKGWILLCFQQNGITLYPDSTTTCGIVSSVNNLLKESSFSLFPNPATNLLTITTNTNTPSEIIIYDIDSRKLMEEKFIKEVSLNIAHLAKGIYLYQITDTRGMITRGKVVKQ